MIKMILYGITLEDWECLFSRNPNFIYSLPYSDRILMHIRYCRTTHRNSYCQVHYNCDLCGEYKGVTPKKIDWGDCN